MALTKSYIKKARKKPGGSNVGKYKGITSFAGPSGGAPQGSYPINTLSRGKSALKLAHNAPNPSGIKSAVYNKYPQLRQQAKHGGIAEYEQFHDLPQEEYDTAISNMIGKYRNGGLPSWLYAARGRAMRNKKQTGGLQGPGRLPVLPPRIQPLSPSPGLPQRYQAGGMYTDNTAQSAGQGVLGTTANIVYQESDPRVLAERRKELEVQAQEQEEAGQEMISRAEEMETIGEATEKEQALLAAQTSQQQFAKGEAVVTAGAQAIQIAQAAKAAKAAKAAGDVAGGAGAAGAIGPGLILSGLGYGIGAIASDKDPTTYTGGEVTGEVLKGAGTGASIGAMVGGPAAPITGLVGGLIGGIYGGIKGLVSRNKARKAEEKAKQEWEARRNKAIRKHNEKVRNVMLTYRSASRQAELEAKTYSGYDIGRNVAYQRGGMFMGVPRYGYAA